jgi:hypothetical protein
MASQAMADQTMAKSGILSLRHFFLFRRTVGWITRIYPPKQPNLIPTLRHDNSRQSCSDIGGASNTGGAKNPLKLEEMGQSGHEI